MPGSKPSEEAQRTKKLDEFQRAQTDRKRGWHDYQLLVNGDASRDKKRLVIETLSRVSRGEFDSVNSLEGWNVFEPPFGDGTKGNDIDVDNNTNDHNDVVIHFVTAPACHMRFPNYRVADRITQATDGAIIIVQPSAFPYDIFTEVSNSYEGKTASLYDGDPTWYTYEEWSFEPIPVSTPSEKELAAIRERTHRPVAIILLESSEGWCSSWRTYDESLRLLRHRCESYSEANQARFFEITDASDEAQLRKVVSCLISDLQNGLGIRFSPPKVRPWELDEAARTKLFDILNIVEKKKQRMKEKEQEIEQLLKRMEEKGKEHKNQTTSIVVYNNDGWWSRFTKFVTGGNL